MYSNSILGFGRFNPLYAISFSAETPQKDAASIGNAWIYCRSLIVKASSLRTRLAASSSASFHFRVPFNFLFRCVGAVLLSGYILNAIADRFNRFSSDAMKSLTVISTKLQIFFKILPYKFGSMNCLNYICGSIGFSHYIRLIILSMPNNATEVRSGEFVWHFDFNKFL